MNLNHFYDLMHETLSDEVNAINAGGAAVLLALNPLHTMHELSILAKDVTGIISVFTASTLFAYNAIKLFSELKKKKNNRHDNR